VRTTGFSSLPELLRCRAGELGDAPLLRWRDEVIGYAEFDRRTDELAVGLAELGVGRGDVVSLYMANRPEFLETWWATLKLGAVFGPVNSQFRGPEAAYVVGHSAAKVAVGDAAAAETLAAQRETLPDLAAIVDVDAGDGLDGLRRPGRRPPVVDIAPTELAALVYTSGTTGRPKGAMLSHGNYLADTAMAAELLPAGPGDCLGMVLPLFHVNAQVATTTTPMLIGGQIAMWDRFSASTFWATVEQHRPVSFSAVPTILAALLRAPGADEADTSSLRYVVCGAAPLTRDLLEAFERKFDLQILEGYGLTEGTCVSSLNPYFGPRKTGSVGLPLRGQEVRLVDDAGAPVADGEPGELLLAGANVMQGYYRDPEATAEALVDGWLRTGDVAYRDADGFLFLVDRKKDMIIRGGENIYPREVEEVLSAHEAVAEAAVIGVPDDVRGEVVHAVVILTAPGAADEQALIAWCAERLAAYKVPGSVELVDDLPRNPTGKVQKRRIVPRVAR